jgi:hypothetical protein
MPNQIIRPITGRSHLAGGTNILFKRMEQTKHGLIREDDDNDDHHHHYLSLRHCKCDRWRKAERIIMKFDIGEKYSLLGTPVEVHRQFGGMYCLLFRDEE